MLNTVLHLHNSNQEASTGWASSKVTTPNHQAGLLRCINRLTSTVAIWVQL